jgi:elongation factor G
VAVVGLKTTFTGNTLCSADQPLVLEEIRFPEPVISQALLPDKNVDDTKMADALARMVRDDPTLKFRTDQETNQLILSGMGELHLEVAVHKLMRDFGVQVGVGKPMVAYRQTLARPVEIEERYIKQSGGRGKYAVNNMKFEPLSKQQIEEWIAKCEEEEEKPDPNNIYFTNAIFGGVVPTEYIPYVEKGFRDGCVKGAKYGFPVVDVHAELNDGKSHEVDSSGDTFRLAAVDCFRKAQAEAGLTVLEPIMNVAATGPDEYLGALIADVSKRRGEIVSTSSDRGRCEVRAFVPLAELFGYTSDLRNFSSGTASFTMEPSHYAPVKEELVEIKAAS